MIQELLRKAASVRAFRHIRHNFHKAIVMHPVCWMHQDPPTDEEVIQAIKSVPCHHSFTDLSVTATSVLPYNTAPNVSALQTNVIIGETSMTAGQVCYQNSTDKKMYKAFAAGTAAQANVLGWLMSGGAINQVTSYVKGGQFYPGATLTVAGEYFLSPNAGNYGQKQTDLAATNYAVRLGYAISASLFQIDIKNYGPMP